MLPLTLALLINLQVGFSLSRFISVCFPMLFYKYRIHFCGFSIWIIALNVTSAVLCYGIAVFAENFEITFTYWILGEIAVMLILTEVMRRAVCKRVSRK
jgi:hypothetical protein